MCIGLVVTREGLLREFEQQLLEADWEEVESGIEVKLCPWADGEETFVSAESRDRAANEKAMLRRFVERIETGLATIAQAA
ncbi:MAG: hypothetical protein NUV77_19730 [Thermoguttaceae bacterium]|nr:hypothetical protein [Thermoguttaceae bacterium]